MIGETLAVGPATFTFYHVLCIARVISPKISIGKGKGSRFWLQVTPAVYK